MQTCEENKPTSRTTGYSGHRETAAVMSESVISTHTQRPVPERSKGSNESQPIQQPTTPLDGRPYGVTAAAAHVRTGTAGPRDPNRMRDRDASV